MVDKSGGIYGWKNDVKYGAGALLYSSISSKGRFATSCLHSVEDVTEAEKWLREGLAAGQLDPTVPYLTRWNKHTKQIEVVVGSLYIWWDDPT